MGFTRFEAAANMRITAFLRESLLLAQKNGDTQKRTSGIRAKKNGVVDGIPTLDLLRRELKSLLTEKIFTAQKPFGDLLPQKSNSYFALRSTQK